MANTTSQEAFELALEQLPETVKAAMDSVDYASELRVLAEAYKLHFDRWEALESDIKLMIVGLKDTKELPGLVVQCAPHLSKTEQEDLVSEIGLRIFMPIREALELNLTPSPKNSLEPKELIEPATPAAPAPEAKAERAPVSVNYSAGQPSHERPIIQGDPYRERPIIQGDPYREQL